MTVHGYQFFHIDPLGVEYPINDLITSWLIGYAGFGMHRLAVATERLPYQHGVTVLGEPYLADREMLLAIDIQDTTHVDWIERDRALRHNLSPFKKPADLCTLKIVRPDDAVRYIAAWLVEYLGGDEGMDGPMYGRRNLTYWAPDPAFYDPSEAETSFGVILAIDGLTFPLPFASPVTCAIASGGLSFPLAFDETTRPAEYGGRAFLLTAARVTVTYGCIVPLAGLTFPLSFVNPLAVSSRDGITFSLIFAQLVIPDGLVWAQAIAGSIVDHGVYFAPDYVRLSGITFPIIFAFAFAPTGISERKTIDYVGNLPTKPVIRCYGPGDNWRLENATEDKWLKVVQELDAGDYLDVDMSAPGGLIATWYDATDASSQDVTSQLIDGSQLWKLQPGENELHVTCEGRVSNGVRMLYTNRYFAV